MIVTGLQPTGSLHLGNLLGAIRPTVALQSPSERAAVFVADYHAITMGHDPIALREDTLRLAAMLIAAGIDTRRTILFKQSAVPAHTELAWVLMCTASRFGWLQRMVQFKEKMESLGENAETPSVGLFAYPVLQAADILLYQADRVPVGEDQSQHLNLAVDIAEKFNREFGPLFTIPRAVINPSVKRVMSLTEPTKKMSKSEDDDGSRINLDDTPDLIRHKIKRATSDIGMVPDNIGDLKDRPGLTNMLTIYATFANQTLDQAVEQFAGKGYGALKPALAEVVIDGLESMQGTYRLIMADRTHLEVMLAHGADQAAELAQATLNRVREVIGVR